MRLIAHAALAGARIVKVPAVPVTDPGPWRYCQRYVYRVDYNDGQSSHNFTSRRQAAASYMAWWLWG